MKFKNIVEAYTKIHGFEVKPDDSGTYHLTINNLLNISIQENASGVGFYVYGIIGSITLEKEAKVALEALTGNLFGRETGKASIGYLPITRSLVLFQFFDEESTTQQIFEEELTRFLGYLTLWMQKL